VNYGRDFTAEVVADLALTQAGSRCPHCNAALAEVTAAELVSVMPSFVAKEAAYTDESGKGQPIWLSSWTIDLGRILAAVAESHHDDYGLILPPALAPYDIHLVWLPSKKADTRSEADDLYLNLSNVGFTVLYDDREARAGAKFNDADLLGCPVRITLGERTLAEGAVEIKLRAEKEKALIELDDVVNYVLEKL
jgi:prolyl-tRNA synthetase